MTRRRVGWRVVLEVLVVAAAVLVIVLAGRRPDPVPVIDPAAVRAACATYAGLDLAELAPICKAAGYQQQVAPEDLDRP